MHEFCWNSTEYVKMFKTSKEIILRVQKINLSWHHDKCHPALFDSFFTVAFADAIIIISDRYH